MRTATLNTAPIADVRPGAAVADSIRNAARAFSTWRKRRHALNELYSLSDRQLADIGVRRGNIPTIVDDLLK